MKKAKINCRECGCSSLNSVAKKKIRGYKTLIHTFTKGLKTTKIITTLIIITIKIVAIKKQKQNKKTLNRRTQSKRGDKKIYIPHFFTYESTD